MVSLFIEAWPVELTYGDNHNSKYFSKEKKEKAITHPIISKNPILTGANNLKPKI